MAVELPDFKEQDRLKTLPPSEMRKALLKRGMNPARDTAVRNWNESQLTLQSFGKVYKTLIFMQS